jgi:hypothetical protein
LATRKYQGARDVRRRKNRPNRTALEDTDGRCAADKAQRGKVQANVQPAPSDAPVANVTQTLATQQREEEPGASRALVSRSCDLHYGAHLRHGGVLAASLPAARLRGVKGNPEVLPHPAAGHVSRQMLSCYSHIRMQAKREVLAGVDRLRSAGNAARKETAATAANAAQALRGQ